MCKCGCVWMCVCLCHGMNVEGQKSILGTVHPLFSIVEVAYFLVHTLHNPCYQTCKYWFNLSVSSKGFNNSISFCQCEFWVLISNHQACRTSTFICLSFCTGSINFVFKLEKKKPNSMTYCTRVYACGRFLPWNGPVFYFQH